MDYIIAGIASLGLVYLPDLRAAPSGEILERAFMTSIGVLQIAIFFGLILSAPSRWARSWRTCSKASAHSCIPSLRWLEVLTYKVIGVKEEVEQRWTQYTAALLSFSIFGFLLTYLLQRAQGMPAVQSAALQRQQRSSGPGVQHRHQFRHEYQLAGVLGRSDYELFRADGGSRRAELRFRSRGHRDRGRSHPGFRPAGKEDHRQLLGGCDARHGIRAATDVHHRSAFCSSRMA